jgi:hypothetical protein
VLSIGILNLIRFVQAIEQWSFLASLPAVSPLYPALSGLFWCLVGLGLFWGLWRGLSWSYRLTPFFAVLYSLYFWIDRLVVDHRISLAPPDAAWPFQAGTNIILLGLLVWILNRRGAKTYFGVIHERQSENRAAQGA